MPRIDRLLPPVAIQLTDYTAEYMETYHKRTYKSFLAMRQHIGTEFKANANQEVINNKTYYKYYSLLGNVSEGTAGHEILKWHGMADENIQEIIDFASSTSLERLTIAWSRRTLFNTEFFESIEETVQILIARRYGKWFEDATESDLEQPQPLTTEEEAVWNVYFALGLFDIVRDRKDFALEENIIAKINIISIAEGGGRIPGDLERANAGLSILLGADGVIFQMTEPIAGIYTNRETLLSKENFEIISQDDFFDIYTENIFIDYKEDQNWLERFIGGLFKLIGALLNFILDILLGTPLFGKVIEWLVEGIASLFGMTLEEARAALVQLIVFIIALYLSVPTGGSSLFNYVEWISSAFSWGGLANETATAKRQHEIQQIEEVEEEEIKRELEQIGGELSLMIGLGEPEIRLNRPEEELRVNGNNNSTYDIFKLD